MRNGVLDGPRHLPRPWLASTTMGVGTSYTGSSSASAQGAQELATAQNITMGCQGSRILRVPLPGFAVVLARSAAILSRDMAAETF
jgi:hypothetical protein